MIESGRMLVGLKTVLILPLPGERYSLIEQIKSVLVCDPLKNYKF